jgi:hypothetical protein
MKTTVSCPTPGCRGEIQHQGDHATCSLHGGRFRIMYWKGQTPLEPVRSGATMAPVRSEPVSPGQTCARHPSTPRAGFCKQCGEAVCADCQLPGHLCPECGEIRTPSNPPPGMCARHHDVARLGCCKNCGCAVCDRCNRPGNVCPGCQTAPQSTAPAGMMCSRHLHIAAAHPCYGCGIGICQVCTFTFAGEKTVYLCPECAMAPSRPPISPERQEHIRKAGVGAVAATLGVLCLFALGEFKALQGTALGLVAFLFIVLPSLFSFNFCLKGLDRQGGENPTSLGCATVVSFMLLLFAGLPLLIGLFGG